MSLRPPSRLSSRPLAVAAAAAALAAIGVFYSAEPQADTANYTTQAAQTSAVVAAANAFMATLSSTQLGTLQSACTMSSGNGTLSYAYVVGLITCWSNLPGSRNGLKLGDLSSTQQAAALAMAGTALSARGLSTMAEIRASDDVIDASTTNSPWGGTKYFAALYGTPSTSAPWQLQLSGHHLALNLSYNSLYPSATPMFIGTEPPNWTDSKGATHAPLEAQRAALYNLAESLQADAVAAASAKLSGTYTDVTMSINATAGCDSSFPATYPSGSTGRGVLVAQLSTAQKTLVKSAISAFTALVPRVTANALNSAYTSDAAFADTYVAYSSGGATKADFSAKPSGLSSQNSYIRIDGPRVWIEFIVQQGVAYPSQVHYHALWRDKTADYGGNFTTGSPATTGLCGASSGAGGGGTAPGGGGMPPGGGGMPPTPPGG